MESFYCPNSNCPNHLEPKASIFVKCGCYRRQGKKELIQNYRCKGCGRRFTERYFTMNYRNRKDELSNQIYEDVLTGSSNSAIARRYKVCETSIRNRLRQIQRYMLLWMSKKTRHLPMNEPLVYDGFESFSESQYFPLHLQHLVGKNSHFIYDFNMVLLNRKGTMTPQQKMRREKLYAEGRKQPPRMLQEKTEVIFERSLNKHQKVILHTDEHPAYQRALKNLKHPQLHHIQTNSRKVRNTQNSLFAINALDMQLRHFLCCFKRETIAFCKRPLAALQKASIFYFHKNFMRPIFWKKKKGREESEISPAMKLGIFDKILIFSHLQSYVDRRHQEWIKEGQLTM